MRLKKILSLLLAMAMLFSCVGITAMAEETGAVAKIGDTEYTSVAKALEVAAETGASEVKILQSVKEQLAIDLEVILKADLTITADSAVTVDFYNNDTKYDLVLGGTNGEDLTIAENVTLTVSDRIIWIGYYDNNINVIVNGSLIGGYQLWFGGDVTVSETGTVGSKGEALVGRRDAKLTINGGKLEANYFNLLSGTVELNNAIATTGPLWLSSNSEGTSEIILNNSTLTSSGNLKMSGGASVTVTDGSSLGVAGGEFGASVIEEGCTLTIDTSSSVTSNAITGSGAINIDASGFDGTEVSVLNTAGMSGFAGNVSVVNSSGADCEISDDGKITIIEKVVENVAEVNGVGYESLTDALTDAKAMTGDVTVEIYDKVTLNQNLAGSFSSINFVGMTDSAEIYLDVQGYIEAPGKDVAFEDLTLSKSAGGYITNAGFMNLAFGVYSADAVTYTNCTFANGAYASSGKNTFTECTFYRSHDRYGLWAYGSDDIIVDGCTFADFRGIKMYDENKGANNTSVLTVKNTDFSAVTDKPAIVLTYGKSVTLEKNTYSSTGVFELDLDGKPNGTPVTSDKPEEITCKNDNGVCGVLVDGKIYTTVAQAAEVATKGSEVTLLHSSTETVEFVEGVTLDKNNFEAEGVTVKSKIPSGSINGGLVNLQDANRTFLTIESYLTYANESVVVKVFDAKGTLLATSSLIDNDREILGKENWGGLSTFVGINCTDGYWNTVWEKGKLNENFVPAKATLFVDGVEMNTAPIQMRAAGTETEVVWAEVPGVPEARLPEAEVKNLGIVSVTDKNGDGDYKFETSYYVYDLVGNQKLTTATAPFDINIAMQFISKDEPEEAATNAYSEYTTDFFIKIDGIKDGSFVGNGCYLAGYYPSFGAWVKIPLDGFTVESGKVYPVISSAGFDFSYVDICTSVEEFICGIYLTPAILEANPDINVNLTLGLSESLEAAQKAEFEEVDDYTYTADDFKPVASIGEKKYTSLQDAIDAAEAGDTIILLENLEIESDLANAAKGYFNIAADDDITIDLNGKTIDVTDNSTGNFIVFYNYGDLTIKNGTVNVTSTVNREWNAQSTVILNRGGNLTVESGTYNHNGGTDMAITLDDSGNSFGDADMTINDGTITSTYTAIRMRMADTTLNGNPGNGLVHLTVNGGTISGLNRGIWGQITNASADALGGLTVTGGTICGGNDAIRMTADESQNIEVSISGTASIEGVISGDADDYAITGGTFSVKPDDAYAAEGYEFKANADGRYGVTEKEEVELFDIYSMNLDLESSMTVNFYVLSDNFEGTDYYAKIVHSAETGDVECIVNFADWKDNGSYKQISYKDLAAKNMADTITVAIYSSNGTQVSNVRITSIKDYAEKYIKTLAGTDDVWVTSFVDMLNYGAEAQKHFGYNTENLANAGIDQYQDYATQNDIELEKNAEVSGPVAYANLDLENRIVYNAYFENVTDDMYVEISYTDHLGNAVTNSADFVMNGSYYQVSVDTLVIADANQLVTITVYNSDGSVYAFVKESINGYLFRAITAKPEFEPLARAMAKFTASAYTALHTK